jgi:hypothetical protein
MKSRGVIGLVLFQNFEKCLTFPVTKIVGTGRVGTLQKLVVARVDGNF